MDLAALRADLATVARTAGYNAWPYEPDDPQGLPAAVVGEVHSMVRKTMSGVCEVELDLDLYVDARDPKDATKRLDLALSLGMDGSLLTIMEDVSVALDRPAWRSARFIEAGRVTTVAMPGSGHARKLSITFSFTA